MLAKSDNAKPFFIVEASIPIFHALDRIYYQILVFVQQMPYFATALRDTH